jgi:hypothetical protein
VEDNGWNRAGVKKSIDEMIDMDMPDRPIRLRLNSN